METFRLPYDGDPPECEYLSGSQLFQRAELKDMNDANPSDIHRKENKSVITRDSGKSKNETVLLSKFSNHVRNSIGNVLGGVAHRPSGEIKSTRLDRVIFKVFCVEYKEAVLIEKGRVPETALRFRAGA